MSLEKGSLLKSLSFSSRLEELNDIALFQEILQGLLYFAETIEDGKKRNWCFAAVS